MRHFPQLLAPGRFSLPFEEPDIPNGKNPSKIRSRIQTSTDCTDRSRPRDDRASRTRTSTVATGDLQLARSVPEKHAGGPSITAGAAVGSRERETQSEDRQLGDGDGAFKKTASLGSAAEKRRYIRDHCKELGSVSKACQVAGLASSSYYYNPDKHHRRRREAEDERLRYQIDQIHEGFPGYGYRRVAKELGRRGIIVNTKRVRRVMNRFGLKPITWRTFVRTTDSFHTLQVYPNLIKNLQLRAINQIWVADITYIRIRSSFVYLAAILDLYSRKIVGWAISKRIDADLCIAALQMALESRDASGCIHHSDRGAQYASAAYVDLLHQHGLQISMSAKANPYDNAFMESFFKTLKYEEVHLWNYETYDAVLERLPFFLEAVYNRKRLHSSIGYVPPIEFEAAVHNMKPADRPVMQL